MSKCLTFFAIFLLVQLSVNWAKAAPMKFDLPAMAGKQNLEYFAETCNDKQWATIANWAKEADFINKQIPALKFEFDGMTLTEVSSQSVVKVENSKMTLRLGSKKYSGSPCDVVVQFISESSGKKSALMDLILPNANAKTQKEEQFDTAKVMGVAMAAGMIGCEVGATYGGGTGFVAGLFGGPAAVATAPAGAAVGAFLGCAIVGTGAAYAGWIAQRKLIENNDTKIQLRSLKKTWDEFFVRNPPPRFISCSEKTVALKSGERTLVITRDPRSLKKDPPKDTKKPRLKIEGDVNLAYPDDVAALFAERVKMCKGSNDVPLHNKYEEVIAKKVTERIATLTANDVRKMNRSR